MIKAKGSLLIIFTIAVVFYACKKQDQESVTQDASALKKVVANWQKQFVINASATDKLKVEPILLKLNYSLTAKIRMKDGSDLFLIEIEHNFNMPYYKYLAISMKDESYSLEGIYFAPVISHIKTFFQTGKLPANEKILVKGLNGFTIKGWKATESGKMAFGKTEFRSKRIATPSLLNFQPDSTTLLPKLNYMADPDQCLYHYTIWHVEETGEILDITYDGRTGNCEPDGTEASGPPQNNCNLEDEDAQALIDGGIFDTQSNTFLEGSGSGLIETTSDGIQKEDWKAKGFMGEYHPNGGAAFSISFWALYAGKRYKDYASMPYWKWYNVPTFSQEYVHQGSTAPCSEVSMTISPISCSLSGDEKTATANFYVQLDVKWTCKVGFIPASTNKQKTASLAANN